MILSFLILLLLKDKPTKITEEKTPRFESWEQAKDYLGEKIIADLVESPNVEGYLTGILLTMEIDREKSTFHNPVYKVRKGYLEIDNQHRFNYWNCKPKNWLN